MRLKIVCGTCCLLCLLAHAGFGQTTNANFELGQKQYNDSDWNGAITNFSKCIETSFDLYDSYSYRAYAKSKIGDTAGALGDCAEVIKLNPSFSGGHFWRACIFVNLTNYDAALANYAIAMRLGPQNRPKDLVDDISDGFNKRRWDCELGGNIAGAISNLDVVVFLNPINSNTFANRAMAKLHQGHFRAALTDANFALKFNQENYLAHVIRAWSLFALDDPKGAAEDCEEAQAFIEKSINKGKANPDLWRIDVSMNKGLLCLVKNDFQAAKDNFQKVEEFSSADTNKVSKVMIARWQKLFEKMLAKAKAKKL